MILCMHLCTMYTDYRRQYTRIYNIAIVYNMYKHVLNKGGTIDMVMQNNNNKIKYFSLKNPIAHVASV